MKILKISFILMLFILMASCSKDRNENKKLSQQKNQFQIGTSFNREIDIEEDKYEKSIFIIKSEMSGTQGIAVYLGEFQNKKLFMTNKHIVNKDLDDCDSTISLVDNKRSIFLGCYGFIYSFEDLDISFLTMDYVLEAEEHFSFEPVVFAKEDISEEQSLILRTIDHNLKALVADQSEDCRVLDTKAQFINDPYPNESLELIASWSLPVGCDAVPGDSGAPIYSHEGLLYGILWGGKHQKEYVKTEELLEQIKQKDQRLWREYNFMVPTKNIWFQLEKDLKNLDPSSEEFQILSNFLST